ncbi:hypothetical protein AMIS_61200 [Actinoplanes missouriensis 431]|uniref:Uncharacterized protein n=1 Tax=Actinoplanes missouriensis (strain ATCC 14538 / DSM 43046 / CBS 188.64 / JCM 3121 / NBRC 102363 / NCIMB 12654 / NRRL B-3342 / UNCC 431) TaxID=512565 RepID=I0HEA3_ACTM4|nr:hypothetical protein [Actinoplanes missouriensis]BAL91340.1 hypothetical protein AMIS_61200 [Actinoplanes missouriensis 431]
MDTDVMTGFGGKQAWLAVASGEPQAVLEALGLRDLGTVGWRAGLDLAHLTDDRVAITPPLPGARGISWVLAAGRRLMQGVDIVEISAKLGAEVQFFATHRVTELHRWQRAADGELVRAFGYVGQTGEVTSWFGDPDPAERDAGLPGELDEETTVLVAERDVFRVAAAWSIDPTTLTGPAPGPLLLGAADA